MPITLNTEFENLNRGRLYPFSDEASVYDDAGVGLPGDFIVDAMLYPDGGDCYLTSISKTADGHTRITISCNSELHCDFKNGDRRAEVYSSSGIHCGVLVLGSDADAIADDPTERKFGNLPFSFGCQFAVGSNGVSRINVGGTSLSGDISFKSSTDALTAKAVPSENVDGSMNLRFDINANNSLTDDSAPGIRKICVLRKPDSLLNVIARDGKPYLFLTRTGLMEKSDLIGRNEICSYKNGDKGGESYKDRTYKDDCGRDAKSGSVTASSSCTPWDSLKTKTEYLDQNDPIKKTVYIDGTHEVAGTYYGYNSIPTINGFTAPSTVSWFVVEATIYSKFYVNSGRVYANLTYRMSEGARTLFYVDYGDGRKADITKMLSCTILFKPKSYKLFYDYIMSNSNGGLGFLDSDALEDLCSNKGWSVDSSNLYDNTLPDQSDDEIREELRSAGLTESKPIYTIRARDFFEHFECKNWEVSSADFLGDEVRHLVGWSRPSTFFQADNGYVSFVGSDGTSVPLPRWIVARYVWWKKYSKNGNQMRHFIVPKERGLVIYTGDYYFHDDPTMKKETSYTSWTCDVSWYRPSYYESDALYGMSGCTSWIVNSNTIHTRLYSEYDPDYDPTYGDDTFYVFGEESIGSIPQEKEVHGIDLEEMDFAAQRFNNRVTGDTLISQPNEAPINKQDGHEDSYYMNSWKGPFEYEYGRLYTPGYGYTPTPSDNEKENNAIKAQIVCTFEITDESFNRFDFDVTDITSDGFVYDNPIHIGMSESTEAPETVSIDDPSDMTDVLGEMKKLTTYRTRGNGIEISIPGLGV